MIELGSRVRDKISGYEGIVIGETKWLTGCLRYVVQGPVKDGKRPDADSFDEISLEVIQTPEQTGIRPYAEELRLRTEDARQPAPGGPMPEVRQY